MAGAWESLESPGLCEEKIDQGRGWRNREPPLGDGWNRPPPVGFRYHVTASRVFGSRLLDAALVGRWLQPGRLLLLHGAPTPAPTPSQLCCSGPLTRRGSKPGLVWGMDRSGRAKAGDPAGLWEPARPGCTSPGLCTRPQHRPSLGRAWPDPRTRSEAAAATGRLRAERKPRAQTGRGGWCERLGPVPARWNTMSRAGGRAGSENSLTQQLGKWVCSLTRSTALAACGQRRPDSLRLPRAGGASTRALLPSSRPVCRSGPPRGRFAHPSAFSPFHERGSERPARVEQALPTWEGHAPQPTCRCGLPCSCRVHAVPSPPPLWEVPAGLGVGDVTLGWRQKFVLGQWGAEEDVGRNGI